MLQEATERRFPPAGDPKECFPAGTGCVGKLLWSRTGTPGQHLGGRAAAKRGNRYNKRKLDNIMYCSTWLSVILPSSRCSCGLFYAHEPAGLVVLPQLTRDPLLFLQRNTWALSLSLGVFLSALCFIPTAVDGWWPGQCIHMTTHKWDISEFSPFWGASL